MNYLKLQEWAIEVPKQLIAHEKTDQVSLKGIFSHYCFVVSGFRRNDDHWKEDWENEVYFRKFSCYCQK